MRSNARLFPPLPPGSDPSHPNILRWEVDRIKEVVEHHHDHKLDKPHMPNVEGILWLRLIGLIFLLILLGLGLISPDRAHQVLGFLVSTGS